MSQGGRWREAVRQGEAADVREGAGIGSVL